jgi:MFS family permease
MVLGTVFAIKMVAYVGIAPIAGAFANRVNRRAFLVALDLVRAGTALCLPFVTEVWQVYVLIFLLQSASAAFTPTFQATIPDVLPDEARYTRALSLSRLAYDLENIVSPMLAGLLLAVMSYNWLFLGTVAGLRPRRCWSSRSCCPARNRPSRAASTTARRAARASTSRRRGCAGCWR